MRNESYFETACRLLGGLLKGASKMSDTLRSQATHDKVEKFCQDTKNSFQKEYERKLRERSK